MATRSASEMFLLKLIRFFTLLRLEMYLLVVILDEIVQQQRVATYMVVKMFENGTGS